MERAAIREVMNERSSSKGGKSKPTYPLPHDTRGHRPARRRASDHLPLPLGDTSTAQTRPQVAWPLPLPSLPFCLRIWRPRHQSPLRKSKSICTRHASPLRKRVLNKGVTLDLGHLLVPKRCLFLLLLTCIRPQLCSTRGYCSIHTRLASIDRSSRRALPPLVDHNSDRPKGPVE
jgi:hypothetical protein